MFAISAADYTATNIEQWLTPFWQHGFYNYELSAGQINSFCPAKTWPGKVSNVAVLTSQGDKPPTLTSDDLQQRNNALRLVSAAAQQALTVKAPYLVVWPSRIAIPQLTATSDQTESKIDLQTHNQFAPAAVSKLCRILFEICQSHPDIVICLPPARNLLEVPLLNELEWIFDDLAKCRIQYWHNTASCHLHTKIGLEDGESWLANYRNRIAGVYLEDVIETECLYPPGMGEVSFQHLKNHLPTKIVRVVRAAVRFSQSDILTSCHYLKDCGLID